MIDYQISLSHFTISRHISEEKNDIIRWQFLF